MLAMLTGFVFAVRFVHVLTLFFEFYQDRSVKCVKDACTGVSIYNPNDVFSAGGWVVGLYKGLTDGEQRGSRKDYL